MIRLLLFICCFGLCYATYAKDKIKVACVGNSVTFGYGLSDREHDAYPAQLQQLLGDKYEVGNFGKSGATLLVKGHRPYSEQEEYRKALAFAGDYVVIHLGLNDTDPRDWPNYQENFLTDYSLLIRTFREANPKCKIWICRMTPITDRHSRYLSGTRDWFGQIQQAIERVAVNENTGLIDLEKTLFNHPNLFADALHPNQYGAGILAHTVYSALTGDYGGLQMSRLYTDNMVLQQDKKLMIGGVADAGEKVTLTIAGQKKVVMTNADGSWQICLDPLKVGGPYTLAIRTAKKKLTFDNVLAGEVWICSGQSNMAFQVKESAEYKDDLKECVNQKGCIRLYNMKPRWETNNVEWNISVMDSLNNLQYYKEATWQECNTETVPSFSAVAYHFGRMLSDSLNVPIGLICNAVGGSGTESWIDRRTLDYEYPEILTDWLHNDHIQDWVRGRAAVNIHQSMDKLQRHPYEPCYLFESGILPFKQYPVKGVVWYQGESNAQNVEIHTKLFHLLVNSWRTYWNQQDLPFYYVQLSSLSRPSWPRFRDSQRMLMGEITHSGMAVSSDIGDSLNVHPKYKKVVGERLAHWALSDLYGYNKIVKSGPLFKAVEYKGNEVWLRFDYASDMHASGGGQLIGFEIAGENGLFYSALATVCDDCVKVVAKEVASPRYVRYGWQPYTRANLVNGAGLPASTFQTKSLFSN